MSLLVCTYAISRGNEAALYGFVLHQPILFPRPTVGAPAPQACHHGHGYACVLLAMQWAWFGVPPSPVSPHFPRKE